MFIINIYNGSSVTWINNRLKEISTAEALRRRETKFSAAKVAKMRKLIKTMKAFLGALRVFCGKRCCQYILCVSVSLRLIFSFNTAWQD